MKMNATSAAKAIDLPLPQESAEPLRRPGGVSVEDDAADALAAQQKHRLLDGSEWGAAIPSHQQDALGDLGRERAVGDADQGRQVNDHIRKVLLELIDDRALA